METVELTIQYLRRLLKQHWFIIATAFMLAILVEAPLIVFPFYAGDKYQGINIAHFGTDEHYYLSRAKDVLEGKNLGQPVLADGKEAQDPTFSYAELILITPFQLAGLGERADPVTIFNICNFVGIVIVMLSIYILSFLISGNRLLSAASALFVVGGYSIVYNKGLFYNDFNIYGRSMSPYFLQLFFWPMLICLYQTFVRDVRNFAVPAAIFFGLLFYIAFYAWTLALALIGSIFLAYLLCKDFEKAKLAFVIGICGLGIGSYTLLGMYKLFTSPAGQQLSYFLMSSTGHTAVMSKIGLLALLLLGLYLWRNSKDKNLPFILAIILSGWVALNQQIITGKFIQYGHYYWYFIVPLCIIVSFYLFFSMIKNEKIRNILLYLTIFVLFTNTAVGQYRSFFTTAKDKLRDQDFAPIINELKREPYGVIFTGANGPYPMLFTIYTGDDLFWEGHALIHQFPLDRLKDALFVTMYLNKKARNNFSGFLASELAQKKDDVYSDLYSSIEGYQSKFDIYEYRRQSDSLSPIIVKLRQELIASLSEEYSKRLSNKNALNDLLLKYNVRYVVWDKELNPEWDFSVLSLKRLLSGNRVELFSLSYP